MKGSIAAIKDAITKSTAERTSPEVISAAYAVVYLIGGVLLASARLLGAAGPFGMAAVAASAEAAAERSSERLLWGGSFWAVAREDSSHFCASKRVKLSAEDLRARGSGQKMPNMSTVAALVTYVCT